MSMNECKSNEMLISRIHNVAATASLNGAVRIIDRVKTFKLLGVHDDVAAIYLVVASH